MLAELLADDAPEPVALKNSILHGRAADVPATAMERRYKNRVPDLGMYFSEVAISGALTLHHFAAQLRILLDGALEANRDRRAYGKGYCESCDLKLYSNVRAILVVAA